MRLNQQTKEQETKEQAALTDSDNTIARQWGHLVEGKDVDASALRPEIYKSWVQCRQIGIDPFGEITRSLDVRGLLDRSAELVAAARPFMEMINGVIAGAGLRIDCIDFEGYFLCAFGDPVLVQESEFNGFTPGSNVAIDTLGTNAAGLCLLLQRPVQVLGPEHYNTHLHNLNCSATPIHAPGGILLGALNILSYATPQNRQTLGLTTSIAKAIENQLALTRSLASLKISNAQLNTVMEYLPQGVICLDREGKVESYNAKALDICAVPPKTNQKSRMARLETVLSGLALSAGGRQRPEKAVALETAGGKKSVLINRHTIEKGERTVILMEDTGRIMSLSAAQSNRTSYTFDDIIGQCPALLKAQKMAAMVAPTDSSVLLVGESGTGKELFAQAIHAASDRSGCPFVAINCGAIPADIIESELFGYEPGAFTGAREAGKPGRLETASGGTLFLDEVEAMPLSFQVKLLRAFSARSLVRVGGLVDIPLDIRIISATKVDLLEEVNQGRFREDLYYRIATFPIAIPPLRDRGTDIRLLTHHFLALLSCEYGVKEIPAEPDFFHALSACTWRGNVRELRNTVERAVLLGISSGKLDLTHLPEDIQAAWMAGKIRETAAQPQNGQSTLSILKLAEQTAIGMVIKEEKGNLSRSAKRLGIARSTLYQKIRSNPDLFDVLKSNTSSD